MIPKNVIILEMVTYDPPSKDETKYEVAVKCKACHAQYLASIKKGIWVRDATCINCNTQNLVNN